MKRCPVCQSTYADDSLRFCLQDGATLESAAPPSSSDEFKTWVLPENAAGSSDLPPTEVLDPEATLVSPHQPPPTVPHRPRDTNPAERAITSQPRTRSTTTVVGLTVIATVALLALGGIGAWLLLRDKTDGTSRSDKIGNTNTTRVIDNQNNTLPNSNTRTASNTNTGAVSSPTPALTPSPTPTPASTPPTNPSAEESAVRAALNGWLYSFRARDIDNYMAHYAGTLEAYYQARNISAGRVRGDKERAFAKYTTIDVRLSNIRIQVDPSGQRAVATFDKTYLFTGPGVNPYTGSGLNRFTFRKIGGAWLIVGEEDLSG